MNIRHLLSGAAMLILGLGQMTGHAQTYYYSGPVNGNIDAELTPGGVGQGGFGVQFGTVNETLYYNPTAGTLEIVGSVSLVNTTGSFGISDWMHNDVGSATLTVGNNGSVSFDDPSFQYESNYNEFLSGCLVVPVSGSGVYLGQAFSTNWDINIYNLHTTIVSASPTSLIFSESGGINGNGVEEDSASAVIDGLASGNSDHEYFSFWQLNSVTALAVPEANSLSLLLLGLLTLALFSWKRRRTAGSQD